MTTAMTPTVPVMNMIIVTMTTVPVTTIPAPATAEKTAMK